MCWPRRKKEENFFKLNEGLSERSKEFLRQTRLNDDCAVCLGKILVVEAIVCANCKKIMHRRCLKQWESSCTKREVTFSCPLCRAALAELKKD